MSEKESHEFFGRVVSETHAAWQVDAGGPVVWIPKSQIMYSEKPLDVGVQTNIQVPGWLAEREGLI